MEPVNRSKMSEPYIGLFYQGYYYFHIGFFKNRSFDGPGLTFKCTDEGFEIIESTWSSGKKGHAMITHAIANKKCHF